MGRLSLKIKAKTLAVAFWYSFGSLHMRMKPHLARLLTIAFCAVYGNAIPAQADIPAGTPTPNTNIAAAAAFSHHTAGGTASVTHSAYQHQLGTISGVTDLSSTAHALSSASQLHTLLPAHSPVTSGGISGSSGSSVLDLSSTAQNYSASQFVHQAAGVTINVGGTSETVGSHTVLTAAELVAANQVMTTGHQELVLNTAGAAVGGSVLLNALTHLDSGGLVIPTGVSALDNAASKDSVSLSGNLTNNGTIMVYSTSSAIHGATLSALNITNGAGAVITSSLSPSLAASLGISNTAVNLNLTAVQSILNNGAINASGALQLSAPNVTNTGSIHSVLSDVAVNTNQLTNLGSITSPVGNVQIGALSSNSLNVNNALGQILAGQDVNFSIPTDLANASSSLVFNGGTVSGANIHFSAPGGTISVLADELKGPVYASAYAADIGANRGLLQIAGLNLTGDPIFSSGGSLDISGVFTGGVINTSGGDFVALAAGNITASSAPANSLINTVGGNVTIAAGVNFTVNGSSNFTGSTACTNCSGNFAIAGASATGGSVQLSNVSIQTSPLAATSTSPSPATSGSISVQAHQGTASGGSIVLGSMTAAGQGGLGEIALSSQTAGGNGGSGGAVTVSADGAVKVNNIYTYGGGGGGGSVYSGAPTPSGYAAGQGGAGGNGGSISLTSNFGQISVNDLNASGGGGGGSLGGSNNSKVSGAAGGQGGNAANITLAAGGGIALVNGTILDAGGGGGNAGVNGGAGGGGGSFGGGGGGAAGAGTIASSLNLSPEGGAGGSGLYGGGGGGSSANGGTATGGTGGGLIAGSGGAGSTMNGSAGVQYVGGVGYTGITGGTALGGGGANYLSTAAGNVGAAGSSGTLAGGAAGTSGTVSVTGYTVGVDQSISSGYGLATSGGGGYNTDSIYAGTVNISQTQGVTASQVYNTNADFQTGGTVVTANITTPTFTTGGNTTLTQGTYGQITGTTTITNTTSKSLQILENNNSTTISNNQLITPAEWVAAIQTSYSAAQTLTVTSGEATAGSLAFNSVNMPASFSVMTIPTSVTANVNVSNLSLTGNFTNNGTINTAGNASLTISAPYVNTVAGTINVGTGTLTLQPIANGTPISIGAAVKPVSGFSVSAGEFGQITAGTLAVGSISYTGGITVAGNVDISLRPYNLQLNSNGNYSGTGYTITLGSNSLTVNAGTAGTVATINTGSVVGNSSSSVNFTSTGALTVDGSLSVGSGILQTTANNSSISISAPITVAGVLNIQANGSGTVSESYTLSTLSMMFGGVNYSPGDLRFNAAGTYAYAIDATRNALLTINATTGAIVAATPLAATPRFVAVDSTNNRVYVSETTSSKIAVFDVSAPGSPVLVTTLSIAAGWPSGIATKTSGGTTTLYVATYDNMVTPITTTNQTAYTVGTSFQVDTIGPNGVGTRYVVLDSSGTYLYTANQQAQTVSIYNTVTGTMVAGYGASLPAVQVGSNPVYITANGGQVFTANFLGNDVSIVNTATRTTAGPAGISNITVGSMPIALTLNNTGSFLYTANQGSNSVSLVSIASSSLVKTFSLPGTPWGIAASPTGNLVYVAMPGSNAIQSIGAPSLITAGTLAISSGSGNIGAADTPIRAQAGSISLATTGSAYLDQSGSATLTYSNVGGTMQIAANGNLNLTGAALGSALPSGLVGNASAVFYAGTQQFAAGIFDLVTTQNNNIAISGAATATGSALFAALGTGSITGGGLLTAPTLSLFSGSGNIGSSATPLALSTSTLTVNTAGSSVYLTDSASVSVNASTAGGTFQLTQTASTSTMTVAGLVQVGTAGTITLGGAAGTNTSIAINGKVLAPSGTVNLTATGTGTLSNTPIAGVSTEVVAPTGTTPSNTVMVNYTVAGITDPLAVSIFGNFAYVTANTGGGGVVYVIDINSADANFQKVVGQVAVGSNPYGIAVNSTGSTIYVANQGSGSVMEISTAAINNSGSIGAVTGTYFLPSGSQPWSVAYDPAAGSNTIFVTASGGTYAATPSSVYSLGVSAAAPVLQGTVNLPSGPVYGAQPKEVVFTATGGTAYVADQFTGSVAVLNVGAGFIPTVASTFAVGGGPVGITLVGTNGYVSNIGDNTVSVFSTSTNAVTGTIAVGSSPAGISSTSSFVYVSNSASNTVSVIDPTKNSVVATVPVGTDPIAFGSFATVIGGKNEAFIPNSGSNNLSLLNSNVAAIDPLVVNISGGSGNLGSASHPLTVTSDAINIHSSGNVYLSVTGTTTINSATTGGTLSVVSDSAMNLASGINVGSLNVATPAALSVGNITASGGISLSGGTTSLMAGSTVLSNGGSVSVSSGTSNVLVSPTSYLSYGGGLLAAGGLPVFASVAPSLSSMNSNTTSTSAVFSTSAFGSFANLVLPSYLLPNNVLPQPSAMVPTDITRDTKEFKELEKDADPFLPIAYTSTVTPTHGSMPKVVSNVLANGDLIRGFNAEYSVVSDAQLMLCDGEMLVEAQKALSIQVGKLVVSIPRGAIALVRVSENGVLSVSSLFDSGRAPITISQGTHELAQIGVGQEAAIASSEDAIKQAFVNDRIGRRGTKTNALHSGESVSLSDISLTSLMAFDSLIHSVRKSNEVSNKDLNWKLEKMAACLYITKGRHGAFRVASDLTER